MDDERRGRLSRSEKRALAAGLEDLGEQLLGISERELARVEMDEALRDAIRLGRTITSPVARRRHKRRLGKLLRMEDADGIREAIGAGPAATSLRDDQLRALERWRTRILTEGDPAIVAFLEAFPEADRQQLRQLARQVARDPESERSVRAARRLFQQLRQAANV